MTQQIVLAICSFALALLGTLLLSALSLVVARSGSCTRSFRFETEARALTLLKEWLSPKQRACYERFRYFDVVGCDSGRRYRIHYGTMTNVHEIDAACRPKIGWCFVPAGYLVAGDIMLAQKIALETNEFGALAVANSFVPKETPSNIYVPC